MTKRSKRVGRVGFNEDELIKIKKATSGLFKNSARTAIKQSLEKTKSDILAAKKLNPDQCKSKLIKLMEEATQERKRAIAYGATSYGDKDWAAAAVSETWLQELVHGTPEGIDRVERLIGELMNR